MGFQVWALAPSVLVVVLHPAAGRVVAPEAIVGGDLMGGEEGFHLQMVFEVDGAELAAEAGDRGGGGPEALLVNPPGGEEGVEALFAGDDPLAEWDGFALHPPVEGFCPGALVGGEAELPGEREDVDGAGVVIELGGLGEAEPGAGEEAADFIGGEGLDGAGLLAGVRDGCFLRPEDGGDGEGSGGDQEGGDGDSGGEDGGGFSHDEGPLMEAICV